MTCMTCEAAAREGITLAELLLLIEFRILVGDPLPECTCAQA